MHFMEMPPQTWERLMAQMYPAMSIQGELDLRLD